MTDVVTLKLSGKAYTCPGLAGKRCGSKLFTVGSQLDIFPDDGVDGTVYCCVVCATWRWDEAFEALAPMRNDWRTPGGVWNTLSDEYAFNVDAAADRSNTKCTTWFGPEDGSDPNVKVENDADGLLRNWFGPYLRTMVPNGGSMRKPEDTSVWINPPYNPKGSIEAWLSKAIEQAKLGVKSVLLVPMATSVAWFNDLVVPYAEWHSFRGRIAFDDPARGPDDKRTSPKQDNLLVIFNPYSDVVGHTAVRDAKNGKRLWTK